MKVGISTASLFPAKHTEEAIEVIKSLGVGVAEVFYSTFYEYRPEFSEALAPRLGGLTVNSVHAMSSNFEPNFFNPTRRVRGDGFYWLDQIARSARLLGCNNYTFHGFMRSRRGAVEDVGFIGERLAEVVYFARNYGIELCLENVSWCTYNRPSFFAEMRTRCDGLYGVFDIKQARRSGYPWQMYIEDMSGAIAYVHLSDINADGKMCLPGKGLYDFKEIFRRLKGAGFDGNALIEVYRGDYGDESELKESCDYLSDIAESV